MGAIAVDAILGAILSLLPAAPPERAAYHAGIIARTCSDTGEAAALVVTLARESGLRDDVVSCRRSGLGGMGAYQLGVGWQSYACASPDVQARGALLALRTKGWPDARKAFVGYTGARHFSKEARERVALWTITKARIECRCCL